MSRGLFLAAAAAPLALLFACTTEVREVQAPPAADADGGSDPAQTTSATEPTIGESCQSYIDCVTEMTPEAAGVAVETYGSTSACWKGTKKERAACEKACGAAFKTCRAGVCALKSGSKCVSCCKGIEPKGVDAFREIYLTELDSQACASCSGCCTKSSLSCRQCAKNYDDSDARKACDDDASCATMLRCVDSCDSESYLSMEP
ncbi:MAG: hypothetical protein KIT84_30695 [Labilithrix sp.]|nr:hypothetical protein [Labilithrix sp.]MCW5815436.1 hypothetical protein [Labilithrix sp.]